MTAWRAFSQDKFCAFGRQGEAGQSYDVAIFGDSNADHFVPMLSVLAERRGLSGRQVTQSTCGPLLGVWRVRQPPWREEKCLEYQEGIIRFIEANPGLRLAVLAANWGSYQKNLGLNGLDLATGKDAGEANAAPRTLEFHVARTLAYLTKRGIKLLVLGQVPHIPKSSDWPVDCAIEAKRNGAKTRACGIPLDEVRSELAMPDRAIRQAVSGAVGASAVFWRDRLCDDEECYTMMDGVFLYRDPGHLNRIGSEYLARYVTLPDLSAPGRVKVIGSRSGSPRK